MMPLTGIRVLDLTELNGFCSFELAEYGAEVIKVEKPEQGDPLRTWPPLKGETSPYHAYLDRGKKSVTLRLATPEGQHLFLELVKTAQVVIENFPNGVMESYGLGYESLKALNPRLIYARLTCFGSVGSEKDCPAYEIIAQAKSGAMHVTGFPHNEPTRIGFYIASHYASSFLSSAICVALYYANATGTGQKVETSLVESLIAITEDKVISYGASGIDPERIGNAHPLINPYDILKCKDGYVAMGISSDDQWFKFCTAFGREEWKEDEKYRTNRFRGQYYFEDLRSKIEAMFSTVTMQEIADTCDAALIPGTMCSTSAQSMKEPQLHVRNMIVKVEDPEMKGVDMVGRPIKFVGEEERPFVGAPLLGADNDAIYGALGLSTQELEQLRRQSAV